MESNKAVIRDIIRKYSDYRYAHSVKADARMELLGYLCSKIVPQSLSSRLQEILLFYSFQDGILSDTELQYLVDNKYEVADILSSPSEIIGLEQYELMQSVNLTQIAISALDGLPHGTTVYNPYAGTNSYAIAAPQYHFVGEELNTLTWAIGKMRLLLHGIDADIIEGNSEEGRRHQKFDAIITTPPFGIGDNVESLLRLYNMLNDGGRLIFFTPLSLLCNYRKELEFRKQLTREQSIRSIVQIPFEVFAKTGIHTALIIVEKKVHQSIKMIDVSYLAKTNKKSRCFIDDDTLTAICECIKGAQQIADYCVNVPYDKIHLRKNYDLRPSAYIVEEKIKASKLPNLVYLRDLLVTYSNVNRAHNGKVRKVAIRDLAENIFNSEKDFLNIPLEYSSYFNTVLEEDNLLLISMMGDRLKPTIFRYVKDGKIVTERSKICAFKLVSNLVSLQYIVSELNKEYVQEQLDAIGYGSYFIHTNADKILDIQISIPSRTTRDEIAEERSISATKLQLQGKILNQTDLQLQQLQDHKHNEYVKLMNQRKHAMQQILNQIEPAVDRLQIMLKNNGMLRATDFTSQSSQRTVSESLHNIYAQTMRLINMVDSLTQKVEFSPSIDVSLYNMLEEFSDNWIVSNYKINIVYMSESGFWTNRPNKQMRQWKYTDYKLHIDPQSFKQVLENIVSNAVKYGFTNKDNNYVIQISTMPTTLYGRNAVEIRIANNGDPLPIGITPEKVFMLNVSSGDGDGMGGWHTKYIIEHYGGIITLENKPKDSEFKIEYIITLPIIETYEAQSIMD